MFQSVNRSIGSINGSNACSTEMQIRSNFSLQVKESPKGVRMAFAWHSCADSALPLAHMSYPYIWVVRHWAVVRASLNTECHVRNILWSPQSLLRLEPYLNANQRVMASMVTSHVIVERTVSWVGVARLRAVECSAEQSMMCTVRCSAHFPHSHCFGTVWAPVGPLLS